jgi:hypothetical protein
MSEKEIIESTSIENKISHMLSKILTEDSDEETDKLTNLGTNENISTTKTHGPNFVRKEKKAQSYKHQGTPLFFGKIEPCNDGNYEQLYMQQKEGLYRHKKFNTTYVTNPPIVINKLNSLYTNVPYSNVGGGFIGRGPTIAVLQKPNLVELLKYQKSLFTVNDINDEGLINDKMEKIDIEMYDMLRGNFTLLIKNQNSCRILQNVLPKTDPMILSKILIEIMPDFYNLLTDNYGNYFCQKFYYFVNLEDKLMILRHMKKYLVQIANSDIGTYPLQSIIERLAFQEEKLIIVEAIVDPRVLMEICSDQHGVHVIEKVIMCFGEELIPFVYEYIITNFMLLANTSTGLVVTKKVIIHAKQPKTIKVLQMLIVSNFNSLIQNAYGNYTIQVALEVNTY